MNVFSLYYRLDTLINYSMYLKSGVLFTPSVSEYMSNFCNAHYSLDLL